MFTVTKQRSSLCFTRDEILILLLLLLCLNIQSWFILLNVVLFCTFEASMGQFKMYGFPTSRNACLGSLRLSTQKLSGSYCPKGILILFASHVFLWSPIRRREKSWISMFIITPLLSSFVLYCFSFIHLLTYCFDALIAECLQEATTASREGRIFTMSEPCWSWF